MLALLALTTTTATTTTTTTTATTTTGSEPGQCVDENVKADLLAKRRMRGAKERLFQQTNRHELTAWGGYYVSDLFDGTYIVGGAYTYHMTEDFGVEATGAYTRYTSAGGPELERTFAVLQGKDQQVAIFEALLVWAPLHAKMRFFADSIVHFDVFLDAGAGVVDSALSTGVAGVGGLGFKFFMGKATAIRLDFRDHVYQMNLLAQHEIANDLTATLGMSVYVPFGE
jgi:outer membrane beta-barrel protein